MQQMQEGHMKDAPEGTSVRWFQINEKTHGSVLTFSSKEVYDSIKAEVDEHRSTQTDCKLILIDSFLEISASLVQDFYIIHKISYRNPRRHSYRSLRNPHTSLMCLNEFIELSLAFR